jgi:DNA polymerase-3 subunit gamma/tau
MEVDGASNRGIGEIRGLRDTIKYLPAKNPYKVYIIDEVHALTADAFNALLKTLEEPPAHVAFIFATTEAHKVPATILSRCQRYDFKRIRTDDIVERLAHVAAAEGLAADPEALTILARQAEGGLRDALGLMDQVIASAGEITAQAVSQALGLINQDLVSKTAQAAFKGDAAAALSLMDQAYDLGSDFRELALRVLEYVRSLALYKANPKAADFLDLTEKETTEFEALGGQLSLSLIHRHFEAWLKFQAEVARHPQPRWLMEAHLIKLCQAAPLTDLAALTARLTALLEASPDLVGKNLDLLAQRARAANATPAPPASPVTPAPAPPASPVTPDPAPAASPVTPDPAPAASPVTPDSAPVGPPAPPEPAKAAKAMAKTASEPESASPKPSKAAKAKPTPKSAAPAKAKPDAPAPSKPTKAKGDLQAEPLPEATSEIEPDAPTPSRPTKAKGDLQAEPLPEAASEIEPDAPTPSEPTKAKGDLQAEPLPEAASEIGPDAPTPSRPTKAKGDLQAEPEIGRASGRERV